MTLAALNAALAASQQSLNDARDQWGRAPAKDAHTDNAFGDLLDAAGHLHRALASIVEAVNAAVTRGAPLVAHEPETPYGIVDALLPPRKLADVEAAAIRDALARNSGDRRRTAKELGISRNTLLRRMDALRLRPPREVADGAGEAAS